MSRSVRTFTGEFRRERATPARCVDFVQSDAHGRLAVRFHGVDRENLPERLTGPVIACDPRDVPPRVYEVASGGNSWFAVARGMQVHEHPRIFGQAIALVPYSRGRKALWTLLLWIARYRWGRAAIERLVGSGR